MANASRATHSARALCTASSFEVKPGSYVTEAFDFSDPEEGNDVLAFDSPRTAGSGTKPRLCRPHQHSQQQVPEPASAAMGRGDECRALTANWCSRRPTSSASPSASIARRSIASRAGPPARHRPRRPTGRKRCRRRGGTAARRPDFHEARAGGRPGAERQSVAAHLPRGWRSRRCARRRRLPPAARTGTGNSPSAGAATALPRRSTAGLDGHLAVRLGRARDLRDDRHVGQRERTGARRVTRTAPSTKSRAGVSLRSSLSGEISGAASSAAARSRPRTGRTQPARADRAAAAPSAATRPKGAAVPIRRPGPGDGDAVVLLGLKGPRSRAPRLCATGSLWLCWLPVPNGARGSASACCPRKWHPAARRPNRGRVDRQFQRRRQRQPFARDEFRARRSAERTAEEQPRAGRTARVRTMTFSRSPASPAGTGYCSSRTCSAPARRSVCRRRPAPESPWPRGRQECALRVRGQNMAEIKNAGIEKLGMSRSH